MIAQIQMRRGTTAEWAASPVVLAAGEPGWDSTLKGMKVGDGSTEWAALPWIDAKNRPDINADKLDGYHASDLMFGNPNILHNWDFRNPVNQRGVSGAISTGTYFYDRWIRNSGTVTTNAAYLTIGAAAVIEQRIEGNLLAGETVTVTVKVGASYISGSGTFPTSAGTASVTLTGWGTATLGYATGYMYVRLSPTAEASVDLVKLELGTVSTLAYDPPMDRAVELAKCQRFCLPVLGGGITIFSGYTASPATSYRFMIPTPVPMRIVPTTNAGGNSIMVYTGTTITSTSIDSLFLSPSGITFFITIPSGATAGTSYNGRVGTSFMLFSDL